MVTGGGGQRVSRGDDKLQYRRREVEQMEGVSRVVVCVVTIKGKVCRREGVGIEKVRRGGRYDKRVKSGQMWRVDDKE